MKPVTVLLYTIIAISLVGTVFIDALSVRYIAVILISGCIYYLSKLPRESASGSEYTSSDHASGNVSINVVNEELNQLFILLESAIKEDLVVVKQELLQIKGLVNNAATQLTESFYSLSSNSDEQLKLVGELISALKDVNNQKTIAELDKTNTLIKNSSADAVRSLQFEDIVIQVSDNSLQYIDNLDKFLNEFRLRLSSRINATATTQDAAGQLKSYVSDVKEIRQEVQLPDRKAVHQNNLAEGGVELF